MFRKNFALVTALSLAVMSASAFAEFTMDEIYDVTKVALEEFKTGNPTHAPHFTGYKVWKSGDDAKAIIYVDHSGMAMKFNYLCHKHDTGLECHAE